jgi:hypothetical protein
LCVFSPCYYKIPLILYRCSRPKFKIVLPYSRYQLNSCKSSIGLIFPMTRMEASIHSWIFPCFNLFFFLVGAWCSSF